MAVKKASTEEVTAEKKTATKKAEKAEKTTGTGTAKKTAAKKPAAKKVAEVKTAEVIIQSPLGGEITGAEILSRVGEVDKVYVRVDENKAYWVRGEETGSVDLW